MREKKIIAIVLAILAIAVSVGTVCIVRSALYSGPVMLAQSAAAVDRADALMQAVCKGDYEAAGQMMYGSPNLGTAPGEDTGAVHMIWNAFINSMEYEFVGESYAVASGVALDMRVRNLDITSVTEALRGHSEAFLSERMEAAEDISEIYDEKNNYRESFVAEILRDATQLSLEEDAGYQERTVTLHLMYDQGQWWVMPDQELLSILSGSLAG